MPARWIGFLLTAAGILGMAGLLEPVVDYTYGITWWGLLILIDEWNFRHRGLSLWRGKGAHAAEGGRCAPVSQARRFAFVTVPLSVLFWVFFETLNLASPQWRYRGALPNLASQILFGFVCFATVIPIEVELYWLIAGEFRLPPRFADVLRSYSKIFAALGLVFALIPFFNHAFWINQGMWVAPALLFLPAGRIPQGRECARRLTGSIAAAGIVAGLLWELLNWFSRTHWEYLILGSWPHLFHMPWIGYIGFVPFAFTSLLVYALAERIPADFRAGFFLYAIAFAGWCVVTIALDQRGLWLGYDLLKSGSR